MRFSRLASPHALALCIALSVAAGAYADSCRCFPGDSCWPSTAKWNVLNSTVGGALIKTSPLAPACRGRSYNEATCNDLKVAWPNPDPQYVHE